MVTPFTRVITWILAMLVSGCASTSPPDGPNLPPVELMQPCPEPAFSARTNGELLLYVLDLREVLRGCNRDKDALREWAGENPNQKF